MGIPTVLLIVLLIAIPYVSTQTPDGVPPNTRGPSGTLMMPKGGTVYQNHVGNVSNIEVVYVGVSDGSNPFGARTATIDINLAPISMQPINQNLTFSLNSTFVVPLAYGLRAHDSGSSQPIWANFVPPVGVCGDYRLVVYERQLFMDGVIHFQSAAPLITFQCANPAPTVFPPGTTFQI